MLFTIEDDIISALKIPEAKVEEVLLRSLSISLYAQRLLPLGKARQLSHMSLWGFEALLTQEKIPRDYTQEELEEDFAFANRPQP
jgi:predicted HTH domain antitoxin